MSPWKSEKQRKACYATKGFGGKVDCKKFGSDSKPKSTTKKVSSRKKY